VKEGIAAGMRAWNEFGANRPIARKILVIVLLTGTIFLLLGGFAPSINTSAYLDAAKGAVGRS